MTTEQTEVDAKNAMREAGWRIVENRWLPKNLICATDYNKFYILNLNDNTMFAIDNSFKVKYETPVFGD